jgi:hypothetical protein
MKSNINLQKTATGMLIGFVVLLGPCSKIQLLPLASLNTGTQAAVAGGNEGSA